MKKALLYFLMVGLAAWLSLTITWWFFMIPALIGGFLLQSEKSSFLFGFITIAVLFACKLVLTNQANEGLLLGRIGEMFQQSPNLILLLSILLAALLAGLASWSGSLTAIALSRER